ncbi:integral membrane protein [Streptomyces viridosporus ATCC 14672]|uniref:Integral membrane protein n=1 Tax=Streptomyces viridosporus (strain ATCC 14672 / DSM 40746 / JCM 4963 / KCTC 9882 / NRRL B-12104 / FH 1290) TaxID=566461 RepID=D5ZZ46_STRV1|nr:RDD family protein [Streptomyces viridosporus]EFE69114.1 integral membrane protein [Streptomyces viridosporus ATCC 14672]
MSELVTGEAVALELRPARLPSRALAVLLDLAAAVAVYIVVTIALVASTASLDQAAQTAITIAVFVLVLVGGPIAVETLSHGRSLGKLACGLRVVRDDGGPIRFRHALVRGLIGVIEILMTFGVVACIASLVSARGRRLGDVFAGTLVVRERVPVGQDGFVPPPPPWLAGRFSGLDLSAVPDGLWLAVRQYLTRMRQLDPQVGWAMAERLAADLAERTGAPVPPGVPPAAYLAAVLQERQAREARRAFGNGAAAGGGHAGTAAPAGSHPLPARPPAAVPPDVRPTVPSADPSADPRAVPPGTPSARSAAEDGDAPAGGQRTGTPREAAPADRPSTGFAPPS